MLDEYINDMERVQALQNILIAKSTGQDAKNSDYLALRNYLLKKDKYKELLPSFVRTNRELEQFWAFIKNKFSTYAERRYYIWQEFLPILDHLEGKTQTPLDQSTSSVLKVFDSEGVHVAWQRALERRTTDPEGAITAARSLLETVCKHILDDRNVSYDSNKIELHELYKLIANELNLSPNQHTEDVFKQILGGCSAVINGLGTLRNRLGDAHGKGKLPVRPVARHAELAVNLSGAMSLFLVSTFNDHSKI
ncbi:abortive infection family protein [bacterium]|nr:abortive infection family protein [bacterium]MBU1752260.1 abortive infection family protein [bacterium]